jgi:uncharacterized membrane protein
MTGPADNYVPVVVLARFRRQAIRVWVVTALVLLAWNILILLAPVGRANGFTGFSTSLYTFFSFICHQQPARSFFIDGEPFGVCSRCFGVYFGLFLGVAVYPLWRSVDEIEPLPRYWLFLACVPMAVDWSLTFFGIWENTHLSRVITGLVLGIACSTFIVPAVVEITRNFTYRSHFAKVK